MQRIFIKTFGCTANLHDAELMAGMLTQDGHKIVETEKSANIIILNICTVKGDTKAIKEIRDTHNKNPKKKIVVTGCVTKKVEEGVRKIDETISVLDTHHIDSISKAVTGKKIIAIEENKRIEKIGLPKIRKNETVHIVLINEGCLNMCSFCSTKLIKGKVHSYPIELIVKEIKTAVYSGAKEIWITSQDCGAYGVDLYKKVKLGELMREISALRGTFFTRVGMANPDNIKKVLPEIISSLKTKNFFKFLHIPLQAGNNNVLKSMNRTYKVEDYVELITTLKKEIPTITIATDIIVGFPGETEEEFQDTLSVIEKTKPDVINISRYIPREGTKAGAMEQIHGRERKRRSRIVTELYKKIALEENEKWVGWKGNIVIDEKGKNNTWVGRNESYKPVIVKGNYKIGDILNVKIEKATTYDLRGIII